MKTFPNKLNVKNKDDFSNIFYTRYLCYFRRDIFEHIIQHTENEYFELDHWCRQKLNNDKDNMNKMQNTIIEELTSIGWTCKLSFGGTALFIYSTEKPPSSCYEDGF
jgi:hypothetical protein